MAIKCFHISTAGIIGGSPTWLSNRQQHCNCDRKDAQQAQLHRNSVVISNNGHTSACTRLHPRPGGGGGASTAATAVASTGTPAAAAAAANRHHHVHATLSTTGSQSGTEDGGDGGGGGEVISIKHHSSHHMCSASSNTVPNHNRRSSSSAPACRSAHTLLSYRKTMLCASIIFLERLIQKGLRSYFQSVVYANVNLCTFYLETELSGFFGEV